MKVDTFLLKGKTDEQARQVAALIKNEVTSERTARGVNLSKNFDMYEGIHAPYFTRRLNEDDQIFKYRKDNAVIVNHIKFTVDLSAKYLYGKASKIVRKFSKKNKETHKKMLGILTDAKMDKFWYEAARKCAVGGEVLARLVAVDKLTGQQPGSVSTETTYPQPMLYDPRNFFVKRNPWGNLVAVVIEYDATDYVTTKVEKITELVTSDSRWMWSNKSDSPFLSAFVGTSYVPTVGTTVSGTGIFTDNKYALNDEFVHLFNDEDRRSDIEDILNLNIALDEGLTDKKHFFGRHGWPQLVTEVSLENVANSPNRIWEISSDFDDGKSWDKRLGFLTWDGKMEDHQTHLKYLERSIFVLSSTAAISTGDLEAIGQLRSGAALITAHSVAIHKTEAKQIVWETNEQQMYRAMASFYAKIRNSKLEVEFPELDVSIRYPKDFVPGAELERKQIHQLELNSHLKPLADILYEEYGSLTEDEIAEKRAMIIKDSEEIVDSARKFLTDEKKEEGPKGVRGKSGSSSQKSSEQKPKVS